MRLPLRTAWYQLFSRANWTDNDIIQTRLRTVYTAAMSYQDTTLKLLRENATKKYYIEYRDFLSNHISHGLYALQYLKCPVDRINKYIDWHDQKLEKAEPHRARELSDDPRPTDVRELLGARKSYYHLFERYERLLETKYDGNLDRLIGGELPKLYNGMVGSLLHGLIHLGYGYASRESWFVCEGLAYLHHSYFPLTLSDKAPDLESMGLGSCGIIEVIEMVDQDKGLIEFARAEITSKEATEWIASNVQRKHRVQLLYRGDKLANYVHLIEFPNGLSAKDITSKDVPRLAKWLVDCAIIVYAAGKTKNNFCLLHGVTAAWSIKCILPTFADNIDVVKRVTRTFLCVLVATFVTQMEPGIDRELLNEKESLARSWDDIIKGALEHESYGEEHIYKLVQVCKAMSEEYRDEEMEAIYKMAAYNCVYYPIKF